MIARPGTSRWCATPRSARRPSHALARCMAARNSTWRRPAWERPGRPTRHAPKHRGSALQRALRRAQAKSRSRSSEVHGVLLLVLPDGGDDVVVQVEVNDALQRGVLQRHGVGERGDLGRQWKGQSAPAPPAGSLYSCQPTVNPNCYPKVRWFPLGEERGCVGTLGAAAGIHPVRRYVEAERRVGEVERRDVGELRHAFVGAVVVVPDAVLER